MIGSPRHDMDVDCEKEPARQKVPHRKYKITITGASHGGPVCLSVSINVLHLDNQFQIKSIPDIAQSVHLLSLWTWYVENCLANKLARGGRGTHLSKKKDTSRGCFRSCYLTKKLFFLGLCEPM